MERAEPKNIFEMRTRPRPATRQHPDGTEPDRVVTINATWGPAEEDDSVVPPFWATVTASMQSGDRLVYSVCGSDQSNYHGHSNRGYGMELATIASCVLVPTKKIETGHYLESVVIGVKNRAKYVNQNGTATKRVEEVDGGSGGSSGSNETEAKE